MDDKYWCIVENSNGERYYRFITKEEIHSQRVKGYIVSISIIFKGDIK